MRQSRNFWAKEIGRSRHMAAAATQGTAEKSGNSGGGGGERQVGGRSDPAHSVKSTEVVPKLRLAGVRNSSAKKPAKLTSPASGICERNRCGSTVRSFHTGRCRRRRWRRRWWWRAGSAVSREARTHTHTIHRGLIRQLPTWTSRMFSLSLSLSDSIRSIRSIERAGRKLTANRRFLRNPKVTDAPPQRRSLDIDFRLSPSLSRSHR